MESDLFGEAEGMEFLEPVLESVCAEVQSASCLPDNTLGVSKNYGEGKDNKGQLITLSVNIYECDCPYATDKMSADHYSSTPALRISRAKLKRGLYIEFSLPVDATDIQVPDAAEQIKNKDGFRTFRMDAHAVGVEDLARSAVLHLLGVYKTNAPDFGCCHRYEACSDAKCCLHPNKLFATACVYRRNLMAGKIFYGKNKNI